MMGLSSNSSRFANASPPPIPPGRIRSVQQKQSFFQRLFRSQPKPDASPATSDIPLRQTVNVQVSEVGSSGTSIFSGYFDEEYLQELRGRQAADVYDKMRRNDADVEMVLTAVKGPILRANWEVEAASDSPEHIAHKELIEHILFEDQEKDWDDLVGEGLTIIEFGHALFEITHKAVVDHPKFGSYVGLAKLGWRSPRTIERWNLTPSGCLASVTQYAYGDLDRKVEIPGEFLLHMAIRKEGDNYEGVSRLRAAYGAWWRKQLYLKLMAIGTEKHAVPPPILEIPEGAQNTAQETNAKAALEAYCSNESNYITLPAGWKLDFMKNPFDPEKLKICVQFEGTQIIRAFVANFLDLGSSAGSGSYSLSFDQSDFFLGSIEYIADRYASPFNKKLIPQLIDMNFGKQEAYPKLKHSGISDKAGKELAETLRFLYDSRYIEPDLDLETHLRKRFGLPAKGSVDVRKKPSSEDKGMGGASEPSSAAAGGQAA